MAHDPAAARGFMGAPGSGAAPRLPGFYSLIALETAGSTNDEARGLAERGAPAGALVWAKRQTAGRGRRGRVLESPAGNLYCSVVLRPPVGPAAAAQLSFVAALALGEGIRDSLPSGSDVRYKWPNDVLIDGGKVAGILLESQIGEKGLLEWALIGTGVNVASFPTDTERPATSLGRAGSNLSVVDVLTVYARSLRAWCVVWERDGFGPVREAWLKRAAGLGEAIEVRLPDRTLSGTFDALDASGSLVLLTPCGRRIVSAGEVFVGPRDSGRAAGNG